MALLTAGEEIPLNTDEWLAEHFERHRSRLHASARRLLGSASDADDAMQEAWIRLSTADTTDTNTIESPAGWLTTVVARVCLNMLRARKTHQDLPIDGTERADEPADAGPEDRVVQTDMVGVALLVVLDQLTPAERLAFVLHDLFDLPFDEIASIVGRTPTAARQLASRARRRVRGADPDVPQDRARRAEVVRAFLAASRSGDFQTLLELLDPEAEARCDAAAVAMGSPALVRGAAQVAEMFAGRARAARAAFVDGTAAAVWTRGGVVRVAFLFTIEDDRVTGIDLVADPGRIAGLAVELIEH